MTLEAAKHLVEHQLRDALDRVLRSSRRTGWALLVLHLSRMAAPGPRPHHRRVAIALLEEMVERCNGQLFGLGNGDVALLFRPPDEGVAVSRLIARLFPLEGALTALRSLWPLPGSAAPARGFVRERIAEELARPPAARTAGERTPSHRAIRLASLPELQVRQSGVRLSPAEAGVMAPVFREVTLAPELLRDAAAGDEFDPQRAGTLLAQVERRLLEAARLELEGAGGPILGGGPGAIHLNLTLAGVMSAPFAELAAALATRRRRTVGIEVPFHEVFADPGRFVMARERLRLAGMHLVLDRVTHEMLAISRPTVLAASLVKLVWDPAIPEAGPELGRALARLGAGRVMLTDCDTEAALRWGLGAGLRLFQGGLIDGMLAAQRIRRCAVAGNCSAQACRSRAATLSPAGRAGCRNPALLDADGTAASR